VQEEIRKDEEFGPLLEMAQPALYRRNGFRLTELPVDSTTRDFAKRQQMVDMASKTGMALPPGPARIFALEEGVDPYQVREAIQHLHDPQSRLVHEFFWFWPHVLGQSRSDEALAALAREDWERAVDLWHDQEQAQSEGHSSTHNLAVVRHLSALDWEWCAVSRELSDEDKEYIRVSWDSAFRRWKLLIEHEAFWSRLTARIRDLNDPRLTAGTARNIRKSLPLALLLINARLAVQAAERGRMVEARRHVDIMRAWEQAPSAETSARKRTGPPPRNKGGPPPVPDSAPLPPLADEALRRALEPLRERVKHLSKTAEAEADADPAHADQPTRRLLQQAPPLLAVIDCLLPAGHPMRDALHDEVALRALGCQISHGNKTEDWETAVSLIEKILPIAVSESARSRIQQNLTTVRGNRDQNLCWFCGKAKGDSNLAIELKMFGDVQRIPVFNGVRVTWRHGTFKVARCSRCKAVHAEQDKRTNMGCGIAFLVLLAVVTGLIAIGAFGSGGIGGGFLFMLACAGSIWGIVAARKKMKKIPKLKGVRAATDYQGHPTIKEMLSQGWQFGEQPTT
jgi:hypothetical protein